jgi:serine phosphatase RsbU (regulator of sigma subunit)
MTGVSPPASRWPRILLVEDDAGDAMLVRECLWEAGLPEAEVVWRRSLAEAVEAVSGESAEIGCVLLDLGLPDADGLHALQNLVAHAGDIPVIVLTGRYERTGTDAVAAGAQDYLVKDDVTADLLGRSVRYAVERKRAQRAELQLRAELLLSAENARLERGLLPTPLLRTQRVSCETYYKPGRDPAVLGGDFFDIVENSDGRLRAVIGDVMGHGPDEAATGVHLRVAWRTLVMAGVPDQQILPNLARLLSAESHQRGFVTACDVSLELDGTLTVRVAGHPAPLLCSAGRCCYLDMPVGPPLGVEGLTAATRRWRDSGGWPETRTRLEPGCSLVLYTDGLLDSYRAVAGRSSLGIAELVEATDAALAPGAEAASWLHSIVSGVPSPSADDTAVVVLTATSAGE